MKTGEQTIFLPPRARVIHYLRQALAAGVFAPGDQLPSEQELCRQVRVSRTTGSNAESDCQDGGFG